MIWGYISDVNRNLKADKGGGLWWWYAVKHDNSLLAIMAIALLTTLSISTSELTEGLNNKWAVIVICSYRTHGQDLFTWHYYDQWDLNILRRPYPPPSSVMRDAVFYSHNSVQSINNLKYFQKYEFSKFCPGQVIDHIFLYVIC